MSTPPPYWFLFRTQSHLAREAHARAFTILISRFSSTLDSGVKRAPVVFGYCGLLQSPSFEGLRKTYILMPVGNCSWNFTSGGGGGGEGGGKVILSRQFAMKNQNTRWKTSSTRSWRLCSRGSKTNPNFQLLNIPSWISSHEVFQSRLINTAYHLLVKNNKGQGRGA